MSDRDALGRLWREYDLSVFNDDLGKAHRLRVEIEAAARALNSDREILDALDAAWERDRWALGNPERQEDVESAYRTGFKAAARDLNPEPAALRDLFEMVMAAGDSDEMADLLMSEWSQKHPAIYERLAGDRAYAPATEPAAPVCECAEADNLRAMLREGLKIVDEQVGRLRRAGRIAGEGHPVSRQYLLAVAENLDALHMLGWFAGESPEPAAEVKNASSAPGGVKNQAADFTPEPAAAREAVVQAAREMQNFKRGLRSGGVPPVGTVPAADALAEAQRLNEAIDAALARLDAEEALQVDHDKAHAAWEDRDAEEAGDG